MTSGMTETTKVRALLKNARQQAKQNDWLHIEGGLSNSPIRISVDDEVIYFAMRKNSHTNLWVTRWNPEYFGGE